MPRAPMLTTDHHQRASTQEERIVSVVLRELKPNLDDFASYLVQHPDYLNHGEELRHAFLRWLGE